jgi:hypothetical protein
MFTRSIIMKKTAITLALALGLGSGAAQAGTINQIISGYGGFIWEDDNSETIVDRFKDDNGTVWGAGETPDGVLNVGDSLRGIVEITKIIDSSSPANFQLLSIGSTQVGSNPSLAAVFEIQVVSRSNVDDPNTIGITEYNFVFGANPNFGTSLGLTSAPPANTVFAWFEDPTANVLRGNNPANCTAGAGGTCEASVTDGTLILSLGFSGDADEGWKSFNTPENALGIQNEAAAKKFGSFNYALGVLQSTIGQFSEDQTPVPGISNGFDNGLVQWIGSGDVLGGSGYQPYTSTSDADLEANRIPEPATLALLGLGLLGMAGLRRRKSA